VLDPKTLGQHLRKRRWVLRHLQRQAAAQMGVSYWTYLKWENGQAFPSKDLIQRVIEYLGYHP
jgi:DNA-binding XRE family transcriptional regulator